MYRFTPIRLLAVIAFSVVVSVAGCGGRPSFDPTEELMVIQAISDISDAKRDPERFRALFIDGSAPDVSEMENYQPYSFRVRRPVKVRGETELTLPVDVTMTRTGDPVGEVQWVVAKADGKWKLKDAPLP